LAWQTAKNNYGVGIDPGNSIHPIYSLPRKSGNRSTVFARLPGANPGRDLNRTHVPRKQL